MAVLVEGVSAQNFHATVPPMPISTSLTVASFRFADTQEPMALQAKQLKNIKSRLYNRKKFIVPRLHQVGVAVAFFQ
jgi:ribosomal protein S30